MNSNKISAYGLLAHINDNQSGIKNLNDIFEPLIKRVLSKMNNNGQNKGILDDLKTNVDKEYALDIPYPILRKIVCNIAEDINRKNKGEFQFNNDGSFIIKNFVFLDYEDIIIKQDSEIDILVNDYNAFLKEKGSKIEEQPTIFDFLDKNRIVLSEYFAKKQSSLKNGDDFILQAQYVNSRKKSPNIYNTLKRLYLGSVITSYLELDISDEKPATKIEFVFDTNFITAILDLNSKEAHHTAIKIIEICQRLGYKMSILDLTIEETQNLIERTAQNYDNTFLSRKFDNYSIYYACDRKGLTKTSIENIAHTFSNDLNKKHGIYTIPNTIKYQNIAKHSTDYKKLKKIRGDERSALHDATAITYVKEKRNNKRVSDFHKANCWFVSIVNNEKFLLKRKGYVSEIIRAVDLVNLLWMTNPNVKSNDILDIGLSRLVANTISQTLPSPRMLNELEDNFKCAKKQLDSDIIVRVANSVATGTLKDIEKLNKLAKEDNTKFIKELQDRDKAIQEKLEKQKQEFENLKTRLQGNYEERIEETRNKLKNNFDERLNSELDNLKSIYKDNIEEIKTEFSKKQSDIEKQMSNRFNEEKLNKKKTEYEGLKKSIQRFENDSKSFVNTFASVLIIITFLVPVILSLSLNNYYYLLGFILPFSLLIIYLISKKKLIKQRTEDKCDKFLDMEYFKELHTELCHDKTSTTVFNIDNISGSGNNFSGEIKSLTQKK